jgi:hypothetical protein
MSRAPLPCCEKLYQDRAVSPTAQSGSFGTGSSQWSGYGQKPSAPRLRRLRPLCLTRSEQSMKLITAHRILIASATVFFTFFALWELNRYGAYNDNWTMARGVLYFLVALGFAIYFKQLKRWYK